MLWRVKTKSIEPSPPLAKLRVRRFQFRESFFSVIYNKKFVVCYCCDLIGTPTSETEVHYQKKINFKKGESFFVITHRESLNILQLLVISIK